MWTRSGSCTKNGFIFMNAAPQHGVPEFSCFLALSSTEQFIFHLIVVLFLHFFFLFRSLLSFKGLRPFSRYPFISISTGSNISKFLGGIFICYSGAISR